MCVYHYCASENPPILHRKETFVDLLYPEYSVFADLTKKEEELGLLSAPDIGFKQSWLRLLNERGISIAGHELRASLRSESDTENREGG